MSYPEFFPFTIPCRDDHTYVRYATEFQNLFLAHRPEKMSWYAYDVVIKSPTTVGFVVYTMRDSARGGIGGKVGEFEIGGVDPDLTKNAIIKQAYDLASSQRALELRLAEEALLRERTERIVRIVTRQATEEIGEPA